MVRNQSEHFSPVRTGNDVSFHEPRYVLGAIVAATGVKPSTLRNWLTREKIELDADEGRDAEKWRLFSTYDAVNIAVLHLLSSIGLSIANAKSIADSAIPIVEVLATRAHGSQGELTDNLVLYYWKTEGAWRDGMSFRASTVPFPTDCPPSAAIVLHPCSILTEVLTELSIREPSCDAAESVVSVSSVDAAIVKEAVRNA